MADIPAGTGLGSSGSFTTALLKAFRILSNEILSIPKNLRRRPVRSRSSFSRSRSANRTSISAYGGVTCFKFCRDGKVSAWPLRINEETKHNLEDSLVMFFTGYSRRAGFILKQQDDKTKIAGSDMVTSSSTM